MKKYIFRNKTTGMYFQKHITEKQNHFVSKLEQAVAITLGQAKQYGLNTKKFKLIEV